MTDFPAAHSMDTDWFAVDADGHVALFRSGEGGAVPEAAAEAACYPDTALFNEDEDDAARAKAGATPPYRRAAAPTSEIVHEPPLVTAGRPELPHMTRPYGEVLVFLDDLAPAQGDVDEGRAKIVRARTGHAVLYDAITAERLAALHEAGACRGCRSLHYDESLDFAARGIFVYDNDSYDASPYERVASPSAAARLDELPEAIRAAAGAVKLPIKFAEAAELQPVDLVPCATWGAGYVPIGEAEPRPVPGREAEYEADLARAREHAARAARGQAGGSGAKIGRWLAYGLLILALALVILALVRR